MKNYPRSSKKDNLKCTCSQAKYIMKNKRNYNGLHFVESGEGEIALVFLHYFGGSSKTWRALIGELSGEYNCIAIDLPGFGDSQELKNSITVSDSSAAVLGLIKFLQLKRYVLVGHSMGGKIALSLASQKPEGMEAIVLIAPSPATPEPFTDKERKQLQDAYGDRTALENIINNITAATLPDAVVNSLVEDNLKASRIGWKGWTEIGSREDISGKMSDVNVPVSVISGSEDAKLSTGFLHREFVRHFPSANFYEVKDAAHMVPVEAPETVAGLIREALKPALNEEESNKNDKS